MARPQNSGGRGTARWHRWLGIAIALPALAIAATGVLINHGDRLDLDARSVHARWLLGWYGIELPRNPTVYCAGPVMVSQLGEALYLDGRPLQLPPTVEPAGRLRGAVALDPALLVALTGQLLLLDGDGRLIEAIGVAELAPGLDEAAIDALAPSSDGGAAVLLGQRVVTSDAGLLRWSPSVRAPEAFDWSRPIEPGPGLRKQMRVAWHGGSITWERVLLDLHSGRLFGPAGIWVVDLVSLLLIVLAGTGVWLWVQRRRSRNCAGGRR